MGHHYLHHQQPHHQAMDGLVNLFTKANHDLSSVQFKLEREFHQVYPDNANPMKLINRIKKIQEELACLREQCLELLAAKQNLIDRAQTTLVANRNLIKRMEASSGIPLTGDAEDPAFDNLNQIIEEWTSQVRSGTGAEKHDSDSEDINKLLFSAIVQSN
ncbi:hypothetical protein Tsubulata_022215 [Turnera subulata]|uniref:Protein FAM33A n=1 Tax=Turnera subulata TaxID=218843 RepID=A0A9Q0JDA9_9ROSI|nr:hypothetical protein Tsubulata_022215 [Turnera subulata]